jgi:hypothetical protein
MGGNSMMRTSVPVIAMIALVGFGSHANAQARCPELTRLRGEATATSKLTRGGIAPTSQRCELYGRLSTAWDAVVQYAKDHREACEISSRSLDDFEKYHDEAEKARDNVCAGRPARPFPPEIIRH